MVEQIYIVAPSALLKVIRSYSPLGLFLCREQGVWVAVDNTTGDAWTEEFPCKRQAVRWLRGSQNAL